MIATDKIEGRKRNRPLKDYAGQRFGRLTAISLVERRADNNHRWCFVCDCGQVKVTAIKSVASGHTSSCGCLAREGLRARNTTHGLSGELSRTYRSWKDMRARCNNPLHKDFADYGGRGIEVCSRWSDFSMFASDMGKRPDGKTLDRIDVDGSYYPQNCRWADAKEQARNKRTNRTIEYQGHKRTLAEWCEIYSLDHSKVSYRLSAGWPLDRVFSPEDGRIVKTDN